MKRKMPHLKANVGSCVSSDSGPEISAVEARSPGLDNTGTPGTTSPDFARNKRGVRLQKQNLSPTPRRKREFVPEEKKDANYWSKREKNNDAAKKSRERRRLQDMELERRIMALTVENEHLKAELLTLKYQLGLTGIPPQSQTLHRSDLSNFLPDLRTLKCAPNLDPCSHLAPPFGQGYRRHAELAFAASQLSPRPSREDALYLAGVFRQPLFKDGITYAKEKLQCVKCNVESYGSSHLSKPQDHQLLVRGLESGSIVASNYLQRNLPHKLRFKMNGNGEYDALQQRQNCFSSRIGGLVEIYPQNNYFGPEMYHHRDSFSDEPYPHANFDRRLQSRLLFPWGLSNHTESPSEIGFSNNVQITKSNAQRPDVNPISDNDTEYNGKETVQHKLNTLSVEIDQLKRLLIVGSV
ncbi:nuclear factor interleukin-3-regulated protein-like [Heterodontus francisci]|uniref:nuclear factor interleukin-3-regulated protein-like n=1 Tax=Heterodontus francisci TaxID=7792 RepID=UPI00355AD870